MTRHETNKYNMYKAVAAVMESNSTLLTEYPVFGEALNSFKESITQIDAVDKKYLTAADGKTKTKSNAEDDLLEEIMPIKSALYALAITTKNEELKVLTVDSEWTLKKMRDAEFLKKAELIKGEAAERLTALATYKITEAMLTGLQEKIDAFGEALNGKDTGFTNRSALRKELNEKFDAADELLKEHFDTLIELVRKSNTLFYDQYFAARGIKDLGMGKKEEEKPAEPAQPK
jgi:hypothetical protein